MTERIPTPQFFTTTEAAKQFRVHPTTVRRWIRAGLLPAWRISGTVRVPIASLRDLVAISTGDQDPHECDQEKPSSGIGPNDVVPPDQGRERIRDGASKGGRHSELGGRQ